MECSFTAVKRKIQLHPKLVKMNSHNQRGWNGCLDVDRDVWGCVNNVTLRDDCWHVMFTGIWPLRCWMTPLTWSTLSLLKGQTSMPWVWCSGRLLAGVQLEVGHCDDIYFLSFRCMIIITLLWVTFTYIFIYVYCKNTTWPEVWDHYLKLFFLMFLF